MRHVKMLSAVFSGAPHLQFSEGVHGQTKLLNTSLQAIELNPNCLRQAHSNRSGTGYGYENMKPWCILTVLLASYVIHLLRSIDASPTRLFKRFHAASTNEHLDLSLSWQISKDLLKRSCIIWSGSRGPQQGECYS